MLRGPAPGIVVRMGIKVRVEVPVSAHLDENIYQREEKVSKAEVSELSFRRHEVRPEWNCTISPK
jgi:hypothetical protein